MPNGHDTKKYGGHDFGNQGGTSDCKHGCGCWMGPSRSGGPTGLDPFGKCPKNPKDGKLLGGNADYDYVVTERIQNLESELYKAKEMLGRVDPSKRKLGDELASVRGELSKKDLILAQIKRFLETNA